jgi:hypothetical protein
MALARRRHSTGTACSPSWKPATAAAVAELFPAYSAAKAAVVSLIQPPAGMGFLSISVRRGRSKRDGYMKG